MPKFFGLFSNSGFTTFFGSTFFAAKGAAATFFFPFFGLLGCNVTDMHIAYPSSNAYVINKCMLFVPLITYLLVRSVTLLKSFANHTDYRRLFYDITQSLTILKS